MNAKITSFSDGHHPEFAAVLQGRDPRTIQFNHAKHLKKDLRVTLCSTCGSGEVQRVQLQCSDCHRTAITDESWTYGVPVGDPTPAPEPKAHARQSRRAYMAPINFYEHCSKCHALCYDGRFGPVPHQTAREELHELLVQRYTGYIRENPAALHDTTYYQQIARRPPPVLPRNPTEWIQQQTWAAETLLTKQVCKECHSLSLPVGSEFPVLAKANITAVWLPNSNFDHEAHQMLKCEACHAQVRTEPDSFKVLVPSIKVCQECHRPGDKTAATGSCFECHVYHDWSKENRVDGTYDVHQLISGSNPALRRAAPPAAIAAIRK